MLIQSEQSILVADETKFERTSFKKICEISDLDFLITDNPISSTWTKKLNESNVQIICAQCEDQSQS